ncbi:hypothetical protein PG990_009162 [Apiospora arundinis]
MALNQFHCFLLLPRELQLMIWEAAVMADYQDRIIPVTCDTKRIMLTRELLQPSVIFGTCKAAREAAKGLYDQVVPVIYFWDNTDEPILVMHPNTFTVEEEREAFYKVENEKYILSELRISTRLDTFLVSPKHQTFSILRRNMPEFMTKPLPSETLAKMQHIMEIVIDRRHKHGSESSIEPSSVQHQFDRKVFPSTKSCAHLIKKYREGEVSFIDLLCGEHTPRDMERFAPCIICETLPSAEPDEEVE